MKRSLKRIALALMAIVTPCLAWAVTVDASTGMPTMDSYTAKTQKDARITEDTTLTESTFLAFSVNCNDDNDARNTAAINAAGYDLAIGRGTLSNDEFTSVTNSYLNFSGAITAESLYIAAGQFGIINGTELANAGDLYVAGQLFVRPTTAVTLGNNIYVTRSSYNGDTGHGALVEASLRLNGPLTLTGTVTLLGTEQILIGTHGSAQTLTIGGTLDISKVATAGNTTALLKFAGCCNGSTTVSFANNSIINLPENFTGTIKLVDGTISDFDKATIKHGGNDYSNEYEVIRDASAGTIMVLKSSDVISKTINGSLTASSLGVEWDATKNVTLTAESTSSIDMDEAITVAKLKTVGSDIAFTGANALTSSLTTIEANTDVSAIEASLGAVTIGAEDKTLTIANETTLTSLSGGALAISTTSEQMVPTTALAEAIRSYTGKVTINGSTKIEYAYDSTQELAAQLIYSSGTHYFWYGRSHGVGTGCFATGRGDSEPTMLVKNGATVNFTMKDLSGWNGAVTDNPAVIRVENGGTLNWITSNGTGFFRDRLILDGGAVVENVDNNFILSGGASDDAAKAQIAMLDAESEVAAEFKGYIYLRNYVSGGGQSNTRSASVAVGTNATLTFSGTLKGDDTETLRKLGAGTLVLTTIESSPAFAIDAGTLKLCGAAMPGSSAISVTGTLVYNTTAQSSPTNTISGTGTITADGCTLDLTKATLTDFTGSYSVINGGTIILPVSENGKSITVTNGTLKLCVTEEQMLEGTTVENVTLPTDGNIVFVLPTGSEVVGTGTKLPSQQAYTYTATVEGYNKWSTVANWKLNGADVTSAPTGEIDIPVVLNLPEETTFYVDVEGLVLSSLIVNGGELYLSEKPLTVGLLSSTYKVKVHNTLTIDALGTEDVPTVVSNVIEVEDGGTLITKGYLNCSAANTIVAGGTLEVASGVTTFNLATTGLNGTLKVAEGATCKNGTNDGPNYDGSPILDIAGTLEVTGTARWSLSKSTTTTLREGAVLKGVGGTEYNYAYDWFAGATITAEGNATIEGNIGSHNAGTLVFDVASSKTLTVSGKYDGGTYGGAAKLKTIGTGTLKLTNTNTYTGGTEIAAGATLHAETPDALGDSGDIAITGTLRFGRTSNYVNAFNRSAWGRMTGTGTVEFADGQWYSIASISTSLNFVNNNTSNGVVIYRADNHDQDTTIGTLSGSGWFRSDLGDKPRSLIIVQSANSEFSGYFKSYAASTGRLMNVLVKGAEGSTEKTLTLSGDSAYETDVNGLSIDATGSVNLTGSWAGNVTNSGILAGDGTIGTTGAPATLTLADGATWDMTDGVLTVTGAVTQSGALTIKTDATVGATLFTGADGSSFNAENITIADRDDVKAVVDDNGTTIKLATAAVCKIDKAEYFTLAEALDKVQAGQTIVLVANAELTAGATLPAGVTIQTAGYTITGADTYLKDIAGNVVAVGEDGSYVAPTYEVTVIDQYNSTTTYQKRFVDAVKAAGDGYIVTLQTSVSVNETITVDSQGAAWNFGVAIDLNGNTITSSADTLFYVKQGLLAVEDGTIETSGVAFQVSTKNTAGATSAYAFDDADPWDRGQAYLSLGDDLEVTSTGDNCILVYNGAKVASAATLETESDTWAAIQGTGLVGNPTRIELTGGSVKAVNHAIYHPQDGRLGIGTDQDKVTIVGATGIEMRAGTLNVVNADITATGAYEGPKANGNGSTVTGAAIALSRHTTGKAINARID
ncbi:MAG: hypothetical protein Q4C03_02420, partial [bacterium]|nr:hypothetical protein [bacterium]